MLITEHLESTVRQKEEKSVGILLDCAISCRNPMG
jgi:hypothetical protein